MYDTQLEMGFCALSIHRFLFNIEKITFFKVSYCAFGLLEGKYWLIHSLWNQNNKHFPFKVTCEISNYWGKDLVAMATNKS